MIENAPVVTMLYAALCGVLLILLALNIVRLRRGRDIPLGVGEGAAIEQPVAYTAISPSTRRRS